MMAFEATQVTFNRTIEIKNSNLIVITKDQLDAVKLLNSYMTNNFGTKGHDVIALPEL